MPSPPSAPLLHPPCSKTLLISCRAVLPFTDMHPTPQFIATSQYTPSNYPFFLSPSLSLSLSIRDSGSRRNVPMHEKPVTEQARGGGWKLWMHRNPGRMAYVFRSLPSCCMARQLRNKLAGSSHDCLTILSCARHFGDESLNVWGTTRQNPWRTPPRQMQR